MNTEEKLKAALKALEFYAYQGHYERDYCVDLGDCTPIIVDDGEYARKTLKEIE